jgi:hypothetical protein
MALAHNGAQWRTSSDFDDFSLLKLNVELFTEKSGRLRCQLLSSWCDAHLGEFRLLQFHPPGE